MKEQIKLAVHIFKERIYVSYYSIKLSIDDLMVFFLKNVFITKKLLYDFVSINFGLTKRQFVVHKNSPTVNCINKHRCIKQESS